MSAEFVELSRLVLSTGDTLTLPINVFGTSTRFISDNTDVATISGGTVYGVSSGRAKLTAYTSGGAFASFTVLVTE